MHTQESNKMIAIYRGVKIVKRNGEDAVFMFSDAASPEYFRCTPHNKYHEDWNLLMAVYDQINTDRHIIGEVTKEDVLISKIQQAIIDCSRNRTYSAIVQFITWYNTQKHGTGK